VLSEVISKNNHFEDSERTFQNDLNITMIWLENSWQGIFKCVNILVILTA